MVTKIMKWVCIVALLLVVSWRPSASYQLPLDFVVCAGGVMVVLALFSIKHRVEAPYAVDNRLDVGNEIAVRLRAWWS